MHPSLVQIQSQRQIQMLAPQMRQSLEFLQAPVLELRTLIQKELELNPALEERPDDHDQLEIEGPSPATTAADEDAAFQEEFQQLARADDDWRDYFSQTSSVRRPSAEDDARRQHLFDSLTQGETLQEHLSRQLGLVEIPESERRLALLLIGCINEDGYLNSTLGELAETTASDPATLERLLRLIQDMDPAGVGARDLRECLLLQLGRQGDGTDGIAARIVRDHLETLAARKHVDIARALEVPVSEVHRAARTIASLDPKPGRPYAGTEPHYVVPEITVTRQDGGYVCVPNRERMPRLRISRHYRTLMEQPDTPKETRDYIRERIRAGALVIRSLLQRQDTILQIAREIVKVQKEFFDHGVTHLRPLVMAEIAQTLGLHETTISRAIAGKYMDTPRGVLEMRFFFTTGYRRTDGQDVSNMAIKDAIERIVGEEDPAHPLSDQAIVQRLNGEGVHVARRTIAKYREELKIPPSHLRRS